MEEPLQVKLIGFGVRGVSLGYLLLFSAREPGAELGRDIAGNLTLQRNEVCLFAVVLIAPDYVLGFRVNQLKRQRQLIATLGDSPVQDRLHIKVFRYRLRACVFALVAKDR